MTTDAVPRVNAANKNEETIVRYTLGERVNHWIGALAYIYLLMTGLAFWSPDLYWLAAVVGGGPIARFWHPWLGFVFAASVCWAFKEGSGDMRSNDADRIWASVSPRFTQNEDDKLRPVG